MAKSFLTMTKRLLRKKEKASHRGEIISNANGIIAQSDETISHGDERVSHCDELPFQSCQSTSRKSATTAVIRKNPSDTIIKTLIAYSGKGNGCGLKPHRRKKAKRLGWNRRRLI